MKTLLKKLLLNINLLVFLPGYLVFILMVANAHKSRENLSAGRLHTLPAAKKTTQHFFNLSTYFKK